MKQNKNEKKVLLRDLFFTFLKIGTFTFGGGYAMISILQEELVTDKKWITEGDMLDMLVIAESTPGVIAVNSATSVGYRMRGIAGAILATLGVVLPSFAIICGLSFAIDAFSQNYWYHAAFTGIQACVTVLIVNALIKMARQLKWNVFTCIVAAGAGGVAVFTDFNVIFLILIGAALGICCTLICGAVKNKKEKSLLPSALPDGEEETKTLHEKESGGERETENLTDRQNGMGAEQDLCGKDGGENSSDKGDR